MIKNVTIEEFVQELELHGRTTPATIVSLTEPNMNKGGRKDKTTGQYPNRFFDSDGSCKILKLNKVNGFIGANYENSVNYQRQREADNNPDIDTVEGFIAESLWHGKGRYVEGSKFLVEHSENGKQYICFKPTALLTQHENEYTVKPLATEYFWRDSNEPLTAEEIDEVKTWIPPKSVSATQDTIKPIFWNVITLTNLYEVAVFGNIYVITNGGQLRHKNT